MDSDNLDISEALGKNLETLEAFEGLDRQAVLDLAAVIRWIDLPAGNVLIRQDEAADAMFVVQKGLLRASVETKGSAPATVGFMRPGAVVGEIALLTGSRRNATVTAVESSRLARLDAADLTALMDRYPELKNGLLDIARRRLRRSRWLTLLSAYFGEIGGERGSIIESRFAGVHLDRGETLFSKGDAADSLYILVHGLLQIVSEEPSGEARVIGTVYRGEMVGEMAILTGEPRTATVCAARDSELVRLKQADFAEINKAFPEFGLAMMRVLAERLKERNRTPRQEHAFNIALVAAGPEVPLGEFSRRLLAALSQKDDALLLTSTILGSEFPATADIAQADELDPRRLDLAAWLEDREAGYEFVLYEADAGCTPWTKRCLKQADQVFIVGRAGDDPAVSPIEKECLQGRTGVAAATRTLVLIHPDGRRPPVGTSAWLAPRRPVGHHHVRWDREEDFARLARIVSRRAVGLVLGGGGARGMAHLGVIRALEERGIPVDLIGGASIGAIIGGAYAMGLDVDRLTDLCRKTFQENNPFSDVTVPVVSLLRSRKIDRAARLAYRDARIEDLWTSFFCVSCDLGACDVTVHREGPVWAAARTSASLPGIMVPIVLDGAVHVDGGVMNNLPGDIMRREAGVVITVDVDSREDMTPEFPEFPSPWKILWSRILPWKKTIRTPNVAEIMMATIMTGSRKCGDAVKEDADLSLEPPVRGIGILDFKAIAETARAGYEYTKERLDRLPSESPLRKFFA